MLGVPLYDQSMQLIGLMRVFSPTRITEEMQGIYERAAHAIGQFCYRIQTLRQNFGSLHRDAQVKGD